MFSGAESESNGEGGGLENPPPNSTMQCGNPTLILVQNGKRIFRSWDLATPIFKFMAQTVVNCGKCLHCRKARSYELAMRCVLHASMHTNNMFLTLTYDETREGYDNKLRYTDIQKFKKKLRSHVHRKTGQKIQIFNVHEYGKNGKKHWHALVFNYNFSDRKIHTKKNGIPLYTSKILQSLWGHGFVTIGDVEEASALYQAQYMEKDYKNGNQTNERKSKSNHQGLGKPYFMKHYKQVLELGYVPFNGHKRPIPRYFEKLAHKHWAWHNDRSYFVDCIGRKKIYTPFHTDTDSSEEIANLFEIYIKKKGERIEEKEKEWQNLVEKTVLLGETPEFEKALKNNSYNLKNKQYKERF